MTSLAGLLCYAGESARIRAFALVQKCFQNDFAGPYDATFWQDPSVWNDMITGTGIATQIRAQIISPVTCELTGEQQTAQGFGAQETINNGIKWTMSGSMLWSPTANAWFDIVNNSNDEYWLVAATATKIHVSETTVRFSALLNIPSSTLEKATFSISAEWTSNKNPLACNIPVGYFV
jgi:hypothetical protein